MTANLKTRPRVRNNETTREQVAAKIKPDLLTWARKRAKKEGKSLNNLIETALDFYKDRAESFSSELATYRSSRV